MCTCLRPLPPAPVTGTPQTPHAYLPHTTHSAPAAQKEQHRGRVGGWVGGMRRGWCGGRVCVVCAGTRGVCLWRAPVCFACVVCRGVWCVCVHGCRVCVQRGCGGCGRAETHRQRTTQSERERVCVCVGGVPLGGAVRGRDTDSGQKQPTRMDILLNTWLGFCFSELIGSIDQDHSHMT